MNTIRFAVHRFDSLENAPFSTDDYSRMKFGCDVSAERFAVELADAFAAQNPELMQTRIVVFPETQTVVAAAHLMARHFVARLNVLLDREGREPVEWAHIHRNFAFGGLYSQASAEERAAALAQDRLYFDPQYIGDATVIMLDDVVITGSHENHMERSLRAAGMTNTIVLAAYARWDGEGDPAVEFNLNHSRIKSAGDMVNLFKSTAPGRFYITTRGVRLMLGAGPNEFDFLVEARAGEDFARELYRCAISKRYTVKEEFSRNVDALRRYIASYE